MADCFEPLEASAVTEPNLSGSPLKYTLPFTSPMPPHPVAKKQAAKAQGNRFIVLNSSCKKKEACPWSQDSLLPTRLVGHGSQTLPSPRLCCAGPGAWGSTRL